MFDGGCSALKSLRTRFSDWSYDFLHGHRIENAKDEYKVLEQCSDLGQVWDAITTSKYLPTQEILKFLTRCENSIMFNAGLNKEQLERQNQM